MRVMPLIPVIISVAPPMEKKGFENAAYQAAAHARQFSQATTASQNGVNSPNTTQESPKGVGETTYQEWFTKVTIQFYSHQNALFF